MLLSKNKVYSEKKRPVYKFVHTAEYRPLIRVTKRSKQYRPVSSNNRQNIITIQRKSRCYNITIIFLVIAILLLTFSAIILLISPEVKKKRKIDTVKNYDKSIVELLTKSDEDEKIKNIIASTGSVSHNDDVNVRKPLIGTIQWQMKSIKDLSSNNETIIGPVKRIGNELWQPQMQVKQHRGGHNRDGLGVILCKKIETLNKQANLTFRLKFADGRVFGRAFVHLNHVEQPCSGVIFPWTWPANITNPVAADDMFTIEYNITSF